LAVLAQVESLLYLRRPLLVIDYKEAKLPASAVLTEEQWQLLTVVLQVLKPFAVAQRLLEGDKYVTGSMVVPMVGQIRKKLEALSAWCDDNKETHQLAPMISGLIQGPPAHAASGDTGNAGKTRKTAAATQGMLQMFYDKFGNGTDVLIAKEGSRRQPRGLKPEQVLATALDPRTKTLDGIPLEEHEAVWEAVTARVAEIMHERQLAERKAATTAGKNKKDGNLKLNSSGPKKKRQRLSDLLDDSDQWGLEGLHCQLPGLDGDSDGESDRGDLGETVTRQQQGDADTASDSGAGGSAGNADAEAESLKKQCKAAAGLEVLTYRKLEPEGIDITENPLLWWKKTLATGQHNITYVGLLARRMLCIPATSAPSERLFSTAGLTVTKKRSRLGTDTVSTLVYLHEARPAVERWKKEHPDEYKKLLDPN
jgi:hypothetical protein